MADTYFPNPVAALSEPRFYTPQVDRSAVFGSALTSLISVASNFRQKQSSINIANNTANLLEQQGLTEEASAYRQVASNYDIDFFSTPEQNEQFSRGALSDAIKLITLGKERELKKAQIAAEASYRSDLALSRTGNLDIRSEELKQRAEDRAADRLLTSQKAQIASIEAQRDNIQKQNTALSAEQERIIKLVETGALDKDSARRQFVRIEADKKRLTEFVDSLDAKRSMYLRSMAGEQNPTEPVVSSYVPPIDPISGITPRPEQKVTNIIETADALRDAGASSGNGVSLPRAGTIETSVGPRGTTTTTRIPINDAVKGGGDPNRPTFSPMNLTNQQK